MKRKYILVAAALGVLCAGAAAYSMNQNTELPSSAPSSSSELTSSSVSSVPANSEPASSSVSPASSAYQVTKEEDTTVSTGTETHPEDQVNITDEQLTEGQQKSKEIAIQGYMDYYGMTREEAEAHWQQRRAEGEKNQEEAQQKRDEYNQQVQAETQAHLDAIDQWYRENTGMSHDEWLGLTNQEKTDWMYAHPDIDFSTRPTY